MTQMIGMNVRYLITTSEGKAKNVTVSLVGNQAGIYYLESSDGQVIKILKQ
ncbi:MAG: hypothetical protein R3345_15580 [Fulvivirga sp.]|nr:hypothetical protein [Fulvivirga sp.]